ncbi:MAG: TspO/MBR family protein [Candidatus Paceibacterota bacterium]|jgi:tryptophan-rich sensory protein
MFKKFIFPLLVSILIALSAGFIGSFFTAPSISSWYAFINKPSFSPPNWLFAPAWILLYILMAIAAFLVWKKRDNLKTKQALIFYGIQLILNALWSIIFFGMKNPGLAFLEIIILWLFILITLIKFYKINKVAGLLFVPYFLWVSFASILNFAVWMLN